ncbi:MAG: VanW family protein [Parcubacteria group bacterium]|jgi:vancomycin resistance protein YoaR
MIGKGFHKFLVLLVCLLTLPLSTQAKDVSGSMVSVTASLPNAVSISVKDTTYTATKDEIKKWLEESTSLVYNPQYFSEIENSNFCGYKKSLFCALSFEPSKKIHIQKKSVVRINEDSIGSYVAALALKVNKNPEDAKLKVAAGKVSEFSSGTKGIELDEAKSAEMLMNYIIGADFKKPLNLPYKESDPKISNVDSIDALGVSDLIGEGRSNFRGSPKNRIFNINVATNRFNGVLIKPGEDFSFVKVLGEVDGDHGYLPELVIKKDKTEPEFGGGICQVSTTAFRAALNSGLKITARRNHAYPVQYYNPQGMDATVYVPRPDLRFMNNTPKYILIQTRIEGTELIFDFYGTNDGRKVELNGPKIIERNPDGSMKTTLGQKVTDTNGKIIIDDTFNSNYDSPSKYPHPGTTSDVLTQKPNGWSDKEWSTYKKQHGI